MWASMMASARRGLRAGTPAPRLRLQAVISPRGSAQSRASSSGEGEAEPEPEPEPGVKELEEIIRAEKRKWKAVKFRRIQAEFGLSGAPPRSLTSEALQQIRFLKEQFPEEWSVPQLAQGFSVSEDVIRRVLRSKFIPSLQRRMKQDAKVNAVTLTLSHGTKPPTAISPGVKVLANPKQVTEQAVAPRLSQATVSLPVLSELQGRAHNPTDEEMGRIVPVPQGVRTKLAVQFSPDAVKARTGRKVAAHQEREECDETCLPPDTEQSTGAQWTEEELEKLTASGVENQMKVVQKGYEFYDQEGNFLYRINNLDSCNNPKQET